jgi:broad specificity phosphatase PhoE
MRLTLVCSLPTSALHTATFPGDEPVDPRSEADASAWISRLGRIDRAWTSPALRAKQTAAALGLAVTIEAALRDCAYGRWTGRRLADIQTEEPDAITAWTTDPAAAPHGGESVLEVLSRVAHWLDGCADRTGHCVAVTHPAVIRAAIIHAIRATPQSFWRIDVPPLSVTDLRQHQGHWRLRSTGCFQ